MVKITCVHYITLVCLFLSTNIQGSQINETDNCVNLYEQGVEAYLENRYVDCVSYFEKALEKYGIYKKKLQSCRLKCKYDAELSEPLYPVDIENLAFYEKAVKQTLCIIKCQDEHPEIFDNFHMNPEAQQLFEEKKPYEYLHICYYQTKDVMRAASSAFTYLVEHPDDKITQSNLKYYSTLEGVNMKEIENFEASDYVYLYVHGADAYERKEWQNVIENMEESLSAYLQTEEECRAQCEGPFDQGWYPDFIPSISNHFTFCLKCKQKCKEKLGSLNGEKHDDLLPSHYHYLQYAYFKMKDLQKACQAVASYLLFYPDDVTMLSNMKFYSRLPKVRDNFFRTKRGCYPLCPEGYLRKKDFKIYKRSIQKLQVTRGKLKELSILQEPMPNIHITMTERELQGSQRFVADNLASPKECRSVIEIAKLFAILGDGYEGKKSPHTIMEKFEGITLGRVLFLVYFRLLNSKYLDLYLKLTEEVRKTVMRYFKVKEELYFTYTHLVCRSALSDSPKNRTDLSHEIHADNCKLLKNGTCNKEPPSYTWRDYSAILYLNNDFDGGEFIFSSDSTAKHVESAVTPKCGRMVGFTSGKENLHGVKAVKEGARCAVAVWFTLDPKYADEDRALAYYVIENDINYHQFSSVNVSNLKNGP
ncbi:hypothetical protein NQ317_013745 [Molorchus minor]|uniref:procollagen-proline 3-dioxygenase n=1 Tax=Molorchus minor TaxID=1323400 RepID=A0ABQ9JCC3_9CUCU|nr:hypothetical protein NQ317_013745 [Molorchus minor]